MLCIVNELKKGTCIAKKHEKFYEKNKIEMSLVSTQMNTREWAVKEVKLLVFVGTFWRNENMNR